MIVVNDMKHFKTLREFAIICMDDLDIFQVDFNNEAGSDEYTIIIKGKRSE